jgi:hypothetical protein
VLLLLLLKGAMNLMGGIWQTSRIMRKVFVCHVVYVNKKNNQFIYSIF